MSGPVLETDPAEEFSGAEIRALTARVTASHRERGWVQLLSDVVYVLTSVAIAVGLVVGASGVVRDLLVAPGAELSASASLPLGTLRALLLLALAALLLGLAARLGPLSLTGAGLRWWLPLPVDRRSLLAGRRRLVLVVWALGGAGAASVVVASTGTQVPAGALAAVAAVGALAGVWAVTLVGLVQHRRTVVSRLALGCDLVVSLTPVLGVLLVLAGWTGGGGAVPRTGAGAGAAGTQPGAGAVGWTVAAVLVLGAVLAVRLWGRRLERLGALALTPSTAAAERAGTAVLSLDPRELSSALERPVALRPRRRSRELAVVRGPATALVAAELLAWLRVPTVAVQVLGLGALVVLATQVPVLSGTLGQVVLLLVIGLRAGQLGAQGARAGDAAPALDALLPLGAGTTRLLRAVVPTLTAAVVLAIGWAPLAATDLRWWLLLAGAAVSFGAAAVRGAYRPTPRWDGPLLATPAGAVPTGMTSSVSTGPDLAVVGALPTVVALVVGEAAWGLVVAQVVAGLGALAVSSLVRTSTR